jgi:predicted XRE-type DNA-binding protein
MNAMAEQSFASIWDAIEDTPEEAQNMRMRSRLMMTVQEYISQSGMTQAAAAKFFGVTQPRISDLKRGRINLFSLDMLVNLASKSATVDMTIVPKEIVKVPRLRQRSGGKGVVRNEVGPPISSGSVYRAQQPVGTPLGRRKAV